MSQHAQSSPARSQSRGQSRNNLSTSGNRSGNRSEGFRGRPGSNHGGKAGGRRSSSRPRTPFADPATAALDAALDAAVRAPEPEDRTFAELGLPPRLVDALAREGIERPFAIQRRTMPDGLAGRDVLGRAQTGSGKTLGFGLPMLARLAGGRRTTKQPRGLVLVPTRELAQQVATALVPLAKSLALKVTTVYGGAPINRQIAELERGVDVVVATPGRLIDLMERRSADLGRVEVTVLDEADYMADLGFMPAVTRILDSTPEGGQRLLFSATLDRGVGQLVTRYLTDPAIHAVAPAASPVDTMDHVSFTVTAEHKVAVATEVARRPGRTLFFVRTKYGADRLAKQMSREGVPASAIHGNLTQGARQRALAAFTAGHPRVLVATDVAARGIHVDDVDLVVHFDPPNDHKDYLHRSGRTARAGSTGTVVALVQPAQQREMARLHQSAGVTVRVSAVQPGHADVLEIATSGTPVVVQPLPERASGTGDAPRRSGRPPRRGGSPRNGAGRQRDAGVRQKQRRTGTR